MVNNVKSVRFALFLKYHGAGLGGSVGSTFNW